MSLSKRDSAFILFIRGQLIPSEANLSRLRELVGEVTKEESLYLDYYLRWIKWNEIHREWYKNFSKSELTSLLKYRTGSNFPLPLGFLSTTNYIPEILGFYSAFNAVVEPLKMPNLNEEQKKILTAEGLSVVNSGPGTGKTTTLIAKALAFASEGVILVSYTNASVNEIYDRIMTYPGSSDLVSKNFGVKKIWCTTIDKIAFQIIPFNRHNKNDDEDLVNEDEIELTYDDSIQLAISEMEVRRSIFYRSGGMGLMYKHIMLDESQDIDEIRYQLVYNLYKQLRMKSLTAFGDPRQRILLNRGRWYSELWQREEIDKYAIGTTYRLNGDLLNLANKLSERRPELHVKLINPSNQIGAQLHGIVATEDVDIADIGNQLLELKKSGKNSWRDFVFITPSLNSNNATSTYSMKVMAVLRSMHIPCYSKEEGSFRADAIFFSTIPGIKGKEYKHVFLLGMDDFPVSFPHIEYEVAQSMIFVANTRAKESITYIFRKRIAFPEGVTENQLPKRNAHISIINDRKVFGLTNEILNDINFYTFIETNELKMIASKQPSLDVRLPAAPEGISKRFWGVVCHLMMSIYLSGNYPSLFHDLAISKVKYLSAEEIRRLKGGIEKGNYSGDEHYDSGTIILNTSINNIQKSELDELRTIICKPYKSLNCNEILKLGLIYDRITSTHSLSRYEENLNAVFDFGDTLIRLTEMLKMLMSEGNPIETEVACKLGEHCMGVVDAMTEKYVIEFKTGEIGQRELIQAYIYGIMTGKQAILFNLITSEITIVLTECGPYFTTYLIEGYIQLKLHQIIVEERVSNFKRYKPGSIPVHNPNTFLVDTEFTPRGNEIFDIALININNIFQSVLQCSRVHDMDFATNWLQLPDETFFYTFDRVMKLLSIVISKNPDYQPTFIYYHCPIDVKWASKDSTKIDIASKAREMGARLGYYQNNGAPPRCSEIYQVVAAPLELRNYLRIHTALSDSLMLYEMIRTNWQT